VADAWQGRGIGSRLIEPSKEIARRFGRQRVLLWGGVYAENTAALGLYGKAGFVEVGRFWGDGEVSVIDMLLAV
jgi:ribosomal protein S18 acetylase RimI-like enzyme